jgi:hypothetical protein
MIMDDLSLTEQLASVEDQIVEALRILKTGQPFLGLDKLEARRDSLKEQIAFDMQVEQALAATNEDYMDRVGIFAFGSIISNPGKEIEAATDLILNGIESDFLVEFARQSSSRGGAPTLAPVLKGGARVKGSIFVLKAGVSIGAAKNILLRRESHRVGAAVEYFDDMPPEWMTIQSSGCSASVGTVLYAKMKANLLGASPADLADRAIKSVSKCPRCKISGLRKDGIQYLADVIGSGLGTPLMPAYLAAILSRLGVSDLQQALAATET